LGERKKRREKDVVFRGDWEEKGRALSSIVLILGISKIRNKVLTEKEYK